jgi:class 3 adenylate cyclase
VSDTSDFLAEVRWEDARFERVLATVLFTDIVGSTHMTAEAGDSAWRDLLQKHHALVRSLLARYRGREIDTAGDGFFATFDGPARAIRCARAIVDGLRGLGMEIRAGLHTGECETIAGKVGGIAVDIGARVAALAGPNEVLVSGTVRDLVAGSGLVFEDAGDHELKGIPDRWHLYRVVR